MQCIEIQLKEQFLCKEVYKLSEEAVLEGNWGFFWSKVRTSAFSMLTDCIQLPFKLKGDGKSSITNNGAVPASLLLKCCKSFSCYL